MSDGRFSDLVAAATSAGEAVYDVHCGGSVPWEKLPESSRQAALAAYSAAGAVFLEKAIEIARDIGNGHAVRSDAMVSEAQALQEAGDAEGAFAKRAGSHFSSSQAAGALEVMAAMRRMLNGEGE